MQKTSTKDSAHTTTLSHNNSLESLTQTMAELEAMIDYAKDSAALEQVRIKAVGKKGILTEYFSTLKSLPEEEKKTFAKSLNALRKSFEEHFSTKQKELEAQELESTLSAQRVDVSLFNLRSKQSIGHPVNYTKDKIIEYFTRMGYELCEGPLVEDDFHNFTALKSPRIPPCKGYARYFLFPR